LKNVCEGKKERRRNKEIERELWVGLLFSNKKLSTQNSQSGDSKKSF
jgi:hypothetical protein